ncbi:ABC transporter ATP-binding protein [Hyphobacterium marinum]|uniref:ABC transporter ATP-binding protein n=1 Tax=Hyphobacterium marinum TaxID=3116574 RepID=A0ABU7M379_9PROT|nr:ABC transporter ATP-binding protein [Hyphobacterium sp. Y6023]MEE2567720.1 ABC transporter ATP-binding protein [Hyphobacterium sp. Y6023]
MSQTAIRTENLSRRFGRVTAVSDLGLEVPAGRVCGFLGPNGAGKTTTIRILLGLIRPDRGNSAIFGHDVRKARRAALTGVGSLVETPAHYLNLTGRENLEITRHLLGLPKTATDRALEQVGLTEAANRKVKGYSLGMRQRLGLARALIDTPKLLILDEPTNGLDPAGIHEMRNLIREAPDRFGATVLVSSHLLGEVEQTADHVALMDRGRLLFQDTLDNLHAAHPGGLEIRTDRAAEAAERLKTRHADARAEEGRVILPGAHDATEIAALNRELVEAEFDISGLRTLKPSLEDLFMKLTRRLGDQS